jgi:hypothetical protein
VPISAGCAEYVRELSGAIQARAKAKLSLSITKDQPMTTYGQWRHCPTHSLPGQ